jgi:hypothetical protein
MSRENQQQTIYTIDIADQIQRFVSHHARYARTDIPEIQVQEYVASLVEQMIAHFEYQDVAVQAFVHHYTQLIAQGVSPEYMYHPLRFLRDVEKNQYHHYAYYLYGFAEDIYNLLVANGMFSYNGRLLASYQGLQLGTLYLIVRPEVPDVFHL